jgi:hypothetical protein
MVTSAWSGDLALRCTCRTCANLTLTRRQRQPKLSRKIWVRTAAGADFSELTAHRAVTPSRGRMHSLPFTGDHYMAGDAFGFQGKTMVMVDYPHDSTIWYQTETFLALRIS